MMPAWFRASHVQCPTCKEWLWKHGEQKCSCGAPVKAIRVRVEQPEDATKRITPAK